MMARKKKVHRRKLESDEDEESQPGQLALQQPNIEETPLNDNSRSKEMEDLDMAEIKA